MKFDSAQIVESVVWDMRLADMPRGENRAVLQRLYNGEPPFNEATAIENNVEINRNDLEGVNLLAQGRRQWNNAFLKPGAYFSVALDSGPIHKRMEWGHTITRNINRRLKRRKAMMEQLRAKGAAVMLHGIGPVNWPDRRSPIASPIPVSSLMIPSETDVDFSNLEYFAIFREYTPAQLYEMTHGPKVDPGWNLPMVKAQLKWAGEQYQKQINSTAYQYMPERIEELVKQDLGLWGSDAVPTVDIWDFYFREAEDGKGWYRRIILDWGVPDVGGVMDSKGMPDSRNRDEDGKYGFLYTSGKRKYAMNLSEILHCQFGDTSAVAPFKYHSVRSLGWMLWGICDLQNRLHCKFNEAVFQSLMWFFRVASNEQFTRLKMANFSHMGVIPPGVDFVKAQERFIPDASLVNMAFARNRMLMSENAASFTQDFSQGQSEKEMTATETMARVNSVNALVSGMLNLAYTYEEYNYMEICRRFCIPGNTDADVRAFRLACLKDGVPAEYLDADRWQVTAERVLGAGNKTLEMAQVQFLQGVRKNLTPDAQRRIDHIGIESATDDPALAEELAPVSDIKPISSSAHDAELATERLLKGLPYESPASAVPEDYALVWLKDMSVIVHQAMQSGGMATIEQITGLGNMAQHVGKMLEQMDAEDDPEQKEKVKQYQNLLGQLMNHVKAFAQRLQQAAAKGNGGPPGAGGPDPKAMAAIQGKMLIDRQKAENLRVSHAQRTAQRQVQFEMDQQRKDRESAIEMRRKNAEADQELAGNTLRVLQELHHERLRAFNEPTKPEKAD